MREALSRLRQHPEVRWAQIDHRVELRDTQIPNDPNFGEKWSLHNPAGPDIDAPEAWGFGTGGTDALGNPIVVAIVDNGLDIHHTDIKENLWTNPGEIAANGIDDDHNGLIDDVHGWDFISGGGEIATGRHGTHVSGIVGARGNNGLLVSGVNWNLGIMPIRAASARTSIVLAGYQYALNQKLLWLSTQGERGANVVATNSSFGIDMADCNSDEYPAWNDMYNELGKAGILSVAATANRSYNVDEVGDVPTTCSSPFIVAVTNTTHQDKLYDWAAWGAKSIDLGAPGTDIVSLLPGNRIGSMSGTSMATPQVTGAIAFLHSVASEAFAQYHMNQPAEAALQLKQILIDHSDPIPDLTNRSVSGGRLNLSKATEAAFILDPVSD